MRALIAVALLPLGGPLAAQAERCRVPADIAVPAVRPDGPARSMTITGYTLALSWSPQFCRSRGGSARDGFQCSGSGGRFGLVVHGLWPEGPRSWPQWCPSPRKLSVAEARRNLCMMPSARLQATEWAKHGTCMARTPEAYFETTRGLFAKLALPDLRRLSARPRLTARDVRQAFVAANPGWTADAVGVEVSRRGWLEELRLCLDKRFHPARCERGRRGAPDGAAIMIWRGA